MKYEYFMESTFIFQSFIDLSKHMQLYFFPHPPQNRNPFRFETRFQSFVRSSKYTFATRRVEPPPRGVDCAGQETRGDLEEEKNEGSAEDKGSVRKGAREENGGGGERRGWAEGEGRLVSGLRRIRGCRGNKSGGYI